MFDPTQGKKTKPLSVRLTYPTLDLLDATAAATGISRVEIVRSAITKELDRHRSARADQRITALLGRCAELKIDVLTVLETALVEEELSPTVRA